MKKVIAAAAGLMLVGAMVGTASAAVSFNGDARARYYFQQDYGSVNAARGAKYNFWNSRVRIQARATAEGGAYAVGRLNYGEGTWDGGNSGTGDATITKAYIGVPMGPVTLEAGRRGFDLLNGTKFLFEDSTQDGAKLWMNATDTVELGLIFLNNYEAVSNGDITDDNDIAHYGGWAKMAFGGMNVKIAGLYRVDDVNRGGVDEEGVALSEDTGGFFGGIEFMGPAGPLALSGAIAMDDTGEDREDTGYGGFLQGGMDFGGTSAALNVGFTSDGYVADGDFGFIMIGGGSQITPIAVGALGDTYWIGVPISFAVSESLVLKANLVYGDFDTGGDAFEISGKATYTISDGATVDFIAGYLAYSADSDLDLDEETDDDPFGMGISFNVTF